MRCDTSRVVWEEYTAVRGNEEKLISSHVAKMRNEGQLIVGPIVE